MLKKDPFLLNYSVEGTGPDVLVIGAVDYYSKTFSKRLRECFRFIFTDHRGFAKTTGEFHPGDYTLDKIVDDIEALRIELKLNKMILIGHSGHAHMAVAYAKKFPQYVQHLVLIGISPLENHSAANQYMDELASPERKALLSKNLAMMNNSFLGRMLAFGPMLWYQYDFDAASLWAPVHFNEEIVNYLWGEVFRTHDLTSDLGSLQMPIDVILGKYDFFNPPVLWEDVKNVNIHLFEKAGHTPQMEDPDAFDALIKQILL